MKVFYDPPGDGDGGVQEHVRNLKKHFEVSDERGADVVHGHAVSDVAHLDVFTLHGLYLYEDWGDKFNQLNAGIMHNLRRARKVISVARWYMDLLESWGIKDAVHIPNGVRVEQFRTGESKYFSYIGSDNRVKNAHDVILLAQHLTDFQFRITKGKGPNLDNVDYLGKIPFDQVPSELADAIAVVMPFKNEVCSTVTLEAFASGTPVLGRRGGSQSDLVRHKETGWIYEDLDGMIEGAEWLVEHAPEMEQACLEEARKYEWASLYLRIGEVYEDSLKPPVSVVVVAYKNRDTLKRSVESIGKGPEIVVVDASGDHEDVLEECVNFAYCKYVEAPNYSIGENRNIGIEQCSRDYICFLDGDDVAFDAKVAMYRFMDEDWFAFANGVWGERVFSDVTKENHGLRMRDGDLIEGGYLFGGNFVPSGAVMVKADVLKSEMFNREIRFGVEDYDLWLRLAHKCGGMRYIDTVVYWYNTGNPGSISRVADQEARIAQIKSLLRSAAELYNVAPEKVIHKELGGIL